MYSNDQRYFYLLKSKTIKSPHKNFTVSIHSGFDSQPSVDNSERAISLPGLFPCRMGGKSPGNWERG